MKIALYIAGGIEQIVLTPETDHERSLLGRLTESDRVTNIHRGSFYHCQGGWIRQGANDESTMLVIEPAPAKTGDLA